MTNPRFASPASFKRHFGSSPNFRAGLVLALIALVSSLPFYSLAQSETAPLKKSRAYTVVAYKGSFVLRAGANGETLCREATEIEARAIQRGSSDGLIQINHLQDKSDSASIKSASTEADRLTIVLRATPALAANQTAVDAFTAAAKKWEDIIKDPITIVVDVDYGDKFFGEDWDDPTVIGATSSPQFFFEGNYPDVRDSLINRAASPTESAIAAALPPATLPTDLGPTDTILLTSPNLRALHVIPLNYLDDPPPTPPSTEPRFPAGRIGFNSNFEFDFDPSNGISGGTDFDAVAVHELGHLLGFNSEVGEKELNPEEPLRATVWDLFRFRPGTANLSTFNTAERILKKGLSETDPHVHFNGGPELRLSTGNEEGDGGDGEQASHWRADEQSGIYIGIMDPTIARNQRKVMTSNDQNAIDYFGYQTTDSPPGPPNDNFAAAQVITGNSGSVNGTNAFATKQVGEPIHDPAGVPSGKSIWYRWIAPNSGTVTITTLGSNYDTLLAVYTGSAVNGLTLPGENFRNDDVESGVIRTSTVTFAAVSGTTYQIAVDGWSGDQGSVTLNWNLASGPSPTPTPTPTPTPGGPNTVQFSSTTAGATEGPNATIKVDLLVTRTGNTSGAASVRYATSNGTSLASASDRSDYEAAAGTLKFGAGETSKTITVFIVDDSYQEDSETFHVTLSSPIATTLGLTPAVTVTITSDDLVNGPNPIFDAEFFVRQHYLDFFNREPDAGGLAFWIGEITSCGNNAACIDLKRTNVSAAFYVSIEFQETGYLVYRMYKAGYGNLDNGAAPVPVRLADFLPDLQQIGNGVVVNVGDWQTKLNNNKNTFAQDFVTRASFVTKHPTTMTPAEFVNALFVNGSVVPTVAERFAAESEFNSAVNTADAAARARALRLVAENPRLSSQEFNKAFVLMQYFGYLRRNPYDPPELGLDYGGYNFWLTKLNQAGGNFVNAEMVRAFILSDEYRLRFGP